MTDTQLAPRPPSPVLVRGLDVTAKAGLLMLLAFALLYPDLAHVRGKGASIRLIAYPLLAFTVPVLWCVFWRKRTAFPWAADLLVTIPCFSDTLGNRMDLYDSIVRFDDGIHFINTGLLTAGVLLLTLHRTASIGATLERALAFGGTATLGWEIAEYFVFISTSSERHGAYTDTLNDLALGSMGAVVAALVVHALWRRGLLSSTASQFEPALSSRNASSL